MIRDRRRKGTNSSQQTTHKDEAERRSDATSRTRADASEQTKQIPLTPISFSLSESLAYLRGRIGESPDFIIRRWSIQNHAGVEIPIAVCYIEGLVDSMLVSRLMTHLLSHESELVNKDHHTEQWSRYITDGDVTVVRSREELLSSILMGNAMVILEGDDEAVAVSVQGGARRGVEEPSTQTVVRGPKEGFTESISTNLALLRNRIRSPELTFDQHIIGKYTQTRVVLAYVDGIVNLEVLRTITDRLRAVDTDSVLESEYIEEFIQDKMWTPFPTMLNTERPDAVAGNLLEGQVAVLVDGTPYALLAPATFFKFFQSSEDYYQRYDIATFLRYVRFLAFVITLLLPSLYIAVTTFQQELIPTPLLFSLTAQREGIPFPALLEAFIMEITFEIIREAGVRMPRVVGSAISIVGALVLGQAAVQAGLISAGMVIVVSFTAISSFVIPMVNMSAAIRLIRFALMLLAGAFGIFGILCGVVTLLFHMASLSSFGVPYLTPIAPLKWSNMKDVFVRTPWPKMDRRPVHLSQRNPVRQGPDLQEREKNDK